MDGLNLQTYERSKAESIGRLVQPKADLTNAVSPDLTSLEAVEVMEDVHRTSLVFAIACRSHQWRYARKVSTSQLGGEPSKTLMYPVPYPDLNLNFSWKEGGGGDSASPSSSHQGLTDQITLKEGQEPLITVIITRWQNRDKPQRELSQLDHLHPKPLKTLQVHRQAL